MTALHTVALGADALQPERGNGRRSRWVPAIIVILVFWAVWFGAWTVYSWLNYPGKSEAALLPRALIAMSGVIISLIIAAALDALRAHPLSTRAVAAILLSIIATLIQGILSQYVWDLFMPGEMIKVAMWMMVTTDFVARLWYFLSQSAIILALSYATDIRERERRIHTLQALAHSAQMRALRNQLNPHFLFNALNSIAGLMSAKRVGEAETMTENLADFLRLTLALDPQRLITLDEELKLQSLYLDIEKVRFPDRLQVTVDVPLDLRNALMPSLVTQPLIENSIKYAVAKSTRPVALAISAKRAGDSLELTVADSGGDAAQLASKGARFGLRNVAERVHMHYGEQGHFTAEPAPAGGFRNIITIPLEVQP